jgi:hypothetical protein
VSKTIETERVAAVSVMQVGLVGAVRHLSAGRNASMATVSHQMFVIATLIGKARIVLIHDARLNVCLDRVSALCRISANVFMVGRAGAVNYLCQCRSVSMVMLSHQTFAVVNLVGVVAFAIIHSVKHGLKTLLTVAVVHVYLLSLVSANLDGQ